MTRDEALQQLRAEKDSDSGKHTIKLFYSLLATAHPAIVEHMEQKAVDFMISGDQVKDQLEECYSDPEKKELLMKMFEKLSTHGSPDSDQSSEEDPESDLIDD